MHIFYGSKNDRSTEEMGIRNVYEWMGTCRRHKQLQLHDNNTEYILPSKKCAMQQWKRHDFPCSRPALHFCTWTSSVHWIYHIFQHRQRSIFIDTIPIANQTHLTYGEHSKHSEYLLYIRRALIECLLATAQINHSILYAITGTHSMRHICEMINICRSRGIDFLHTLFSSDLHHWFITYP